MNSESAYNGIPSAEIRPERRTSWLWILPIAAAMFAGWLVYQSWALRGTRITVQFSDGHGLRADDEVRYRGIVVGRVIGVELAGGLDGIVVTAELLEPQARNLARAGTRFWVVRPQVGFSGVAGLETLVGPRYLALLPGDGAPRRSFVGLAEPPVVESIAPDDLEIVLQSPRRGSMRPGAPVLYRQVPVGTILSVGLEHDAGAVIARVHVQSRYAALVREKTRFWNVGGLDAELGLRGLSFKLESVETLLAGGVALATPPGGGDAVRNGHHFTLAAEPEPEWLEWEPMIVVGAPFLPPGAIMSAPLRAVLAWRDGRWIKSDRLRRGWVLQTEHGLLGPADLLAPEGANGSGFVLEVGGRPVPLSGPAEAFGIGLVRRDVSLSAARWPDALMRAAEAPEDCVVVADRAVDPIPLAAARLVPGKSAWSIDPAVPIDESWHGACVLGRRDGRLIGLLLVRDAGAEVALLPAAQP